MRCAIILRIILYYNDIWAVMRLMAIQKDDYYLSMLDNKYTLKTYIM